MVGGAAFADQSASAELYDPATGTFSPTGSLATGRYYQTATSLSDGKVLVAGGWGGGNSLASAEIYTAASSGGGDNGGGDVGGGSTVLVTIDIKPGDSTNAINPKSKGKIPVAILSSASFDAPTQVDITTLSFGHTGDEASLASCAIQDVNADGLMDLMCHFDTQAAAFQAGDTVAVLKGKTKAGVAFQATDSVRLVK